MILQLYTLWQTKNVRTRTTLRQYIRYFSQKKTHRSGLYWLRKSSDTLFCVRFKKASKEASKAGNYFPNRVSTFASATFKRVSIASNAGSAGVATASTIC